MKLMNGNGDFGVVRHHDDTISGIEAEFVGPVHAAGVDVGEFIAGAEIEHFHLAAAVTHPDPIVVGDEDAIGS